MEIKAHGTGTWAKEAKHGRSSWRPQKPHQAQSKTGGRRGYRDFVEAGEDGGWVRWKVPLEVGTQSQRSRESPAVKGA